MNIGFSDENMNTGLLKKQGFFSFFSFLQLRFSCPICSIYLLNDASAQRIQRDHCSTEVKREDQLSAFIHRNAREIKGAKVSTKEENFDKHTRKHLSQRVTIWQHKDHVLNYYSPGTAEEAEEEQG